MNRSEHLAKLISDSLGWFVDLPKVHDGFYSPYFRFQVMVDVNKPLKRGLTSKGLMDKTMAPSGLRAPPFLLLSLWDNRAWGGGLPDKIRGGFFRAGARVSVRELDACA